MKIEQVKYSTTEQRNEKSKNIHLMSPLEITKLMNEEDQQVPMAIGKCLPEIARCMAKIAEILKHNGRLFYLGAGTSGRLGVVDASECPPTFNSPQGQIVGIIAGGDGAMRVAVEGAEDNPALGIQDLKDKQLTSNDVVCGISTSGFAPYVFGALKYAKELGCFTIMLTCNPNCVDTIRNQIAIDEFIVPVVGPEVVTGSTRLKAGTATKMVLNMLTTGAFVLNGYVYENLMINVKASNSKLRDRQRRILMMLFPELDKEAAGKLLERDECEQNVAKAIEVYKRATD
jgi:N-acetylmuramic acid 6-phosphate etherase